MKIFSILLALVLISFSVAGCGCTQANGSGGSEQIGTIQVPDGPKIKVIFNGPSELTAEWEKVGMNGFQMQFVGTLTNISGQKIKFTEIAFLLDGTQIDYISGRTLAPNEKMPIAKGFPNTSDDNKLLEITVKGFSIMGSTTPTSTPSTSTISPALVQTTTPKTITEYTITEDVTFTQAVKNPRTPEEVFATYCFLCGEGEYSKAELLCTENFLEDNGRAETFWKKISGGGPATKVIITEVVHHSNTSYVSIDVTIYFKYRGPRDFMAFSLRNENGQWKND